MSESGSVRFRRGLRRLLPGLVAAVLLWIGLGQPNRLKPHHVARWVEADGVKSRALFAGSGDTTLVFLHGYGESLLAWRAVLDQFTRDYRVVALDLPGFGVSVAPDFGFDYSGYEHWLGAVLARYTSGPIVVVGHSMGGELAAGLALEHPDRIVGAILLAPAGAGINPIFADSGSVASPAAQWVTSAFTFVVPAHDTNWLREPALDSALQATSDSFSRIAVQRVMQQFDFAALETRFGDLRQPVLLIWGRQDPTIPLAIGDRIAAVLPCRRFVQLFTLHRPHQTVPDTVAAEMKAFLHSGGTLEGVTSPSCPAHSL